HLAGDVALEAGLAREIADRRPRLEAARLAVDSEHRRAPRRRPDEIQHNSDRGRFSGAVQTEKPEHLARSHFQRQISQRGDTTVTFAQMLELDGRRIHGPMVALRINSTIGGSSRYDVRAPLRRGASTGDDMATGTI